MSFASSGAGILVSKFRIRHAVFAILVAIAVGTLGFHLIEGWSLVDSLYVTVQTVTTVGFGDVTPQDSERAGSSPRASCWSGLASCSMR